MSRVQEFVGSIRFRLSVLYSSVVFGLGAVVLGATFYFLRRSLRRLPLTFDSRLAIVNGRPIVIQDIDVNTAELVEQAITARALSLISDYLVISLIALFLVSLIVGWVIAGRALRPVDAITAVAREIQASDLSRRIAHVGPDDELGRLAATFDAMLDRLDAAFSAQKRFLADTSHDLRTPLAVIRSNVDVLAEDPDATPEDWREAAAIVQRNADRMSAMIDDLLATARFEVGAAAKTHLDLADLIAEAAVDLRPRGAGRDVTVHANPVPAPTEGIEETLRRAIGNLADNAIKAAPDGSQVVLASGLSEGWAWVAVADEGEGIDPAVLENGSGPGLGLAIVRQVVAAHGGRLAAHPGEKKGTTMVIWLPSSGSIDPPPEVSPL